MMRSTRIVRTAVVRKPGVGLVSFGLVLGLKNLVLFTSLVLLTVSHELIWFRKLGRPYHG